MDDIHNSEFLLLSKDTNLSDFDLQYIKNEYVAVTRSQLPITLDRCLGSVLSLKGTYCQPQHASQLSSAHGDKPIDARLLMITTMSHTSHQPPADN